MKAASIDKLVRPLIRAIKPYSSARDEFSGPVSGMVFLDANENPNENGVNRYPDPYQRRLKEKIARRIGVSQNQILLGNGSDEVLDLLFRVFCEPGQDSVITLPPTYGMYQVLAGINAAVNVQVPLDECFQPDIPAIQVATSENTKILFLCSPNNPTGNILDRDRVRELLKAFRGLVVIDEAYVDFSGGSGYAGLLKEHANLVITQTFSKAYGMAGIRLGICLANPEIIAYLNRIKPPYNVNELTQRRALELLEDPERIERQVAEIIAERDRLAAELPDIGCIRKVFPSDANFLLVRVDDADKRYRELLNKGIVVRNRSGELNCSNTLRLTIGTPKENNTLLESLKSISEFTAI